MPRPLRIEYENAYYHVMNRGRRQEDIFHSEEYFQYFLLTLEEAHQRFGLQILCYCLMSNHYHLLVKTPEANLGRAMRHINGVYTQRHNRLHKTDGSLFRGRYKSIVVEEESYQLQLSRYIHRNPLEAGMVEKLDDYPWSSYQHYISKKTSPIWLYTNEVLSQLSMKRKVQDKYRAYVELGIDEELKQFYGKGNIMPYLGSDEFRSWTYDQRVTNDKDVSEHEKSLFRPDMQVIIERVAKIFDVLPESILKSVRGRRNLPRWVAMYLCQEIGSHRLADIALKFGLKRTGSIPTIIGKLKELLRMDKNLKDKVNSAI